MATKPSNARRRRSARQRKTQPVSQRWYLEPLNRPTNILISRVVDEGDLQREVKTSIGRRPALWECPRSVVDNFLSSQGDGIAFKVFRQFGEGMITEVATVER